MVNPATPNPQNQNTVRMKGADLAKIHEEMEAGNRGGTNSARKCIRWDYLQLGVRVEMRQPGGVTTNLRYAARNISAEGMGILHSSFVHPGTTVIVWLTNKDKKETPIDGSVMRCRHVKGLIHEVGIRFKTSIDVREFMNVDPMEGRFTLEHVDAEKLCGSLLHVDDSPMDRRLVRHFLKDTQLNVVSCEDAKTALERSKEGFDVMLIENGLPDMPGAQLVEQLRTNGISAPIIMLTADTRQSSKDAAKAAKASAIVAKPVTQEKLLQAIAEFLLLEGASSPEGGGPLYTTLKAEDPTYKFVPEFMEELRQFAEKINKSIAAEDVAMCRRLAFQIKGAVPALGFAPIGDSANATMLSLDATMSVAESMKQLRSLVSMCLRVRSREEREQRKAG